MRQATSHSAITACTVMLAGFVTAACAPPEGQRVQGGGPGADIGNRSAIVEMHRGSVVYPRERCAVQGAECTGPLAVSGRTRAARSAVSGFVLEHMGRGGQVRRVLYESPPDLALPEPGQVELPFPGPETGAAPTPPSRPGDTTAATPAGANRDP